MSDAPSILVIDDDAGARETLRRVLESAGCKVTLAEDGERGLRAFRASRPDLVITDIVMTEKDGIGTILALRSEWPHGPIIAISGGSVSYLTWAQRLGASATLKKPFEPEDLVDAVGRCLAARGRKAS
jgi:two-component system chemotaxis response regulator CheY